MARLKARYNAETTETEMVPFTAEEESARDIEEAAYVAGEPARKWITIRLKRNQLLAESDWRAMPDAPTMTDAWATYREALRNLPSTQSDPDDIVFPTEPT
jgi:hypothetical protein